MSARQMPYWAHMAAGEVEFIKEVNTAMHSLQASVLTYTTLVPDFRSSQTGPRGTAWSIQAVPQNVSAHQLKEH